LLSAWRHRPRIECDTREQLLARAEADGTIAGAAFTGSHATGESDRWSDTDLVLAVRGELTATLNQWTKWPYDDLGAQHHLLPTDLTAHLRTTLARSLAEPELRRALTGELERSDPVLATRLRPMLAELAGASDSPAVGTPLSATPGASHRDQVPPA
jgi:predicted nucleotidyltransferase